MSAEIKAGTSTAEQVLLLLKTRGPQTAQQLAAALALTSMGARRQLEAWMNKGIVRFEDAVNGAAGPAANIGAASGGSDGAAGAISVISVISDSVTDKVGRPARHWRLTEAGHARFPDRHADLTLQLITQVRALFGQPGLERLLAAREHDSERLYEAALADMGRLVGPAVLIDSAGAVGAAAPAGPAGIAGIAAPAGLAERVGALAGARSAEGYMAEVTSEPDGSLLLIEHHCPICAAARHCQDFCRSELDIFQRVLGPECSVSRSEHLLSGARRCVYRIRPV